MVDAVFGGAEDDARPFLMPIVEIVGRAEKLHAAHHRHVPVKQDDVGTIDAAEGQRLLSIGRLLDGPGHAFKDMERDLANEFTDINDQTRFRNETTADPREYGVFTDKECSAR